MFNCTVDYVVSCEVDYVFELSAKMGSKFLNRRISTRNIRLTLLKSSADVHGHYNYSPGILSSVLSEHREKILLVAADYSQSRLRVVIADARSGKSLISISGFLVLLVYPS